MRLRIVVFAATWLLSRAAWSQCPDGTPPPCGPRRATALPPLDDRAWIVLPFENRARSVRVDWLRDASANLLSLELQRWSDTRVVDDRRVTDLVRTLPARTRERVALTDALTLGRRMGARHVIVGGFLETGSRVAVDAEVYDVATGRRARVVRETISTVDSVAAVFGRLAVALLGAAPPPGSHPGDIGTTRIDAYREYLAGIRAERALDPLAALRHLDSALALDSTFALAHFARAYSIGWENSPLVSTPADIARLNREDAGAARRYSSSLPPREQALIGALFAFSTEDYASACDSYRRLVESDSSDVDALNGFGDCSYHFTDVAPTVGDTMRLHFRGDLNAARRAFRRVLTIDPGDHRPYAYLGRLLTAERRAGCRSVPGTACVPYAAVMRRQADSLILVPVSQLDTTAITAQLDEAYRTGAIVENLTEAKRYAEAWVALDPSAALPHYSLGVVLMRLGDLAGADRELSRPMSSLPSLDQAPARIYRSELALKLGRSAEARILIDSVGRAPPGVYSRTVIASLVALSGRVADLDSVTDRYPSGGISPAVWHAYYRAVTRLVLTGGDERTVEAERALVEALAASRGCTAACQARFAVPTLIFGPRLPRSTWPVMDSTSADPRLRAVRAIALHDTLRLRHAALILDTIVASASRYRRPDDGTALFTADVYLALGDSSAALQRVRDALESAALRTPLRTALSAPLIWGMLWPRALAMRGDLASGLGLRDEARASYGRLLALWDAADEEMAPFVARVRRAYDGLGGR